MKNPTRREFLQDVGRGMLAGSVGFAAATELLLVPRAFAEEEPEALTFGSIEPLVALMQETPANRLIPTLVGKIRGGTSLRDLVAAAALANARTFGGEDYVGFHTMMALSPSYRMSLEMPEDRRPLPVLKVLYRNANRIQEAGGRKCEVLHPVKAANLPTGKPGGEALRDAVRAKDVDLAERTFAALSRGTPAEAFDHLLVMVEDSAEVHRVVLPYRAFDLLDVVGPEHAHTLLRQSVRYCVRSERQGEHHPAWFDEPRRILPEAMEKHHLLSREPGAREADDAWVETLGRTIFLSSGADAAGAVAEALAAGFLPSAVGEAIALAANQLVLRDHGRPEKEAQPGKPAGSVHGDSIGVHACDSANAWRNMARVANPRNQFACLILGAYQVALDRVARGGDFLRWTPHPLPEESEKVTTRSPEELLTELEGAVRENDQARAAALTDRYGEAGGDPRKIFDLFLLFATSEDGALHAEKYYRTVSEEFVAARPRFRSRQLVALARVTASEYGKPAPGLAEARQLLKLS